MGSCWHWCLHIVTWNCIKCAPLPYRHMQARQVYWHWSHKIALIALSTWDPTDVMQCQQIRMQAKQMCWHCDWSHYTRLPWWHCQHGILLQIVNHTIDFTGHTLVVGNFKVYHRCTPKVHGAQFRGLRFLLTTQEKRQTNVFTILAHHMVLYECLSSHSDHSTYR